MKRSERLIDMTYMLLSNPNQLISLTTFTEKYQAAKSSISEDLAIVKKTFEQQGVGKITTVAGAAGGVKYSPKVQKEEAEQFIAYLSEKLQEKERLLPGGYIYLSDLLGDPMVLRQLGKLIASVFEDRHIDVIMTVATKGVPIAQAVADYLNIPFVIVRRDSKITEGSTVSINYVSGSSTRVEKMEVSKRTVPSGSNVLIVDDFLKNGGTLNGLRSLIKEFHATAVGAVVFCESGVSGHDAQEYASLLKIESLNLETQEIHAGAGNFLELFHHE